MRNQRIAMAIVHAQATAIATALTIGLALAATRSASAQTRALDAYVRQGLERNLALRQQAYASERAAAVVAETRANFLPTATLNARYTDFQGSGVDFGQFINPVFATLNQLTGTNQFPTDVNVRLPLRQETTVRVAQPLYQPAILAGYRAAQAASDAQVANRDAAAVEVAAGIRSAWLQHAKARRLAELRVATRGLLEEQVRVIARLVEAGRATPDALSRARAELSEATQLEAEARQLADASAQAFNLMLARPLDEPVDVDTDSLVFAVMPSLDDALAAGRAGRPELRALSAAERAALAQRRAAQGGALPTLAVAVDYGFQGNEYRFTPDDDFTSVSLVASWALFSGGRHTARAEQAAADARRLALQGEEARRGVELQVRLAWQSAEVARTAIGSARDQRVAAERTHELVRRRADEGLASFLELSQARTQRTAAQLNEILTTYDYYLRRVELDRATATAPRSTP